MFLLTQFIGLTVLNAGLLETKIQGNKTIGDVVGLPQPETQKEHTNIFVKGILPAFIIAIVLLFLLMKFKIEVILRLWFFAVVTIALVLSFLSFINIIPWFIIEINTALIIAIALALPLAFIKIFKRNLIIHNFTELLIYPGIAIVFVPLLNIYTIIALLILISVYDMWAVWKSGVMQKMAKFQIKKLKIFSGFFVPYLTKKQKLKLEKMKKSKLTKKKAMKVNVAILGGGDVIFPIIAAGVMLKTLGLLSAIFVIIGATLGLGYLFFLAKKRKFYPAMPFITAGIFAAMILSWLIL
jgi:presenilin-like A22 family membrane protease